MTQLGIKSKVYQIIDNIILLGCLSKDRLPCLVLKIMLLMRKQLKIILSNKISVIFCAKRSGMLISAVLCIAFYFLKIHFNTHICF